MLWSAHADWGVSKLVEKHLKAAEVRSAEWNDEVPIQGGKHPIQAEQHWWELRSALQAEECWKREGWVNSVESDIGALVGNQELPS